MKLLEGKKGIITGALNDKSIAWKVAELAIAEGAQIVLTNTPLSIRMGSIEQFAQEHGCTLIPADATNVEDLDALVKGSMEALGGKVDFVLHSIGMSPNVRKGKAYETIDYGMMGKTLDISAISFHKLIQALYNNDAMNEWGSIVALSYIAAERAFQGYNDMADAKALLQSIARSYGIIYGKKKHVRINTVSQSPTMTTAGQGIAGMSALFGFADKLSPLGNASAEDCARYITTLFSDYTRMVTMQNLYHDGGFSSTGASDDVIEIYMKGLEQM